MKESKVRQIMETMMKKSKLQKISGNYRSLEEKALVDKKEADSAFRKCLKEYIELPLKQHGFIKYKTNTLIRNTNNILDIICFHKTDTGSKSFTVDIAIMPLAKKNDFLSFSLGGRLGFFKHNYGRIRGEWWDFATLEFARESFAEVRDIISSKILDWFEQFKTHDGAVNFFEDPKWLDKFNGGTYTLLVPVILFAKFGDYDRALYWLKKWRDYGEKYNASHILILYDEWERAIKDGPAACNAYMCECEKYTMEKLGLTDVGI